MSSICQEYVILLSNQAIKPQFLMQIQIQILPQNMPLFFIYDVSLRPIQQMFSLLASFFPGFRSQIPALQRKLYSALTYVRTSFINFETAQENKPINSDKILLKAIKLQMKFEYEWRNVQFHEKNISSRMHSSIVALKGKIYLFGGKTSRTDEYFNGLFEYEPLAKAWHQLKTYGEVPAPRCKSTMLEHDGKIYLYGGLNYTTNFNDIYIFDPQSLAWIRQRPLEYSLAPQLIQPILAVQLFHPYLITIYNGIRQVSTPIIWVYSFNSKEWRSIEINCSGGLLKGNFSSCMLGHFIYIFGKQSLKEAPFLTQFDFSKLIKSDNYDDVEIIRYELSGWKDGLWAQAQSICLKGYDDQIIIVYHYINKGQHCHQQIRIDKKALRYYRKNIYGTLNHLNQCRAVMLGSCLVTIGEFHNGQAQLMYYMNIARNQLPPFKYKKIASHTLQPVNEETVVVIINGIKFQVCRRLIDRFSYFQDLMKFSECQKAGYEISIINVKEAYIRELMGFINGAQLKQVNIKHKREQFERLINLAYLADYFCIKRVQNWVQDYIYQVSQNQSNMDTIALANMVGLTSFQSYCSGRYVKCLRNPEQIQQILKGSPYKILNKRVDLIKFDLEHQSVSNSFRMHAAETSIPEDRLQPNELSSALLNTFKAMIQQHTSY